MKAGNDLLQIHTRLKVGFDRMQAFHVEVMAQWLVESLEEMDRS